MIRNRDFFALYRIRWQSNVAEKHTALVWAHRMCDALRVVEEYAKQAGPHRFCMKVLDIDVVRTPDTDTEDYATVAWVDGAEPVWT